MEKLLHYTWKHKLWPLRPLATTDGREVEVIDPGLYNRRDSGPDFFNAKVKIDGQLWVGNVELHTRSSDWYQHGHEQDDAYANVVLHVVELADCEVTDKKGRQLPQIELPVPQQVRDNYAELLRTDQYPPCYRVIPSLSRLKVHAWMAALQTERLEQKTEAIARRAAHCNGSWEDALFITLARNYGFGVNTDAFETWAMQVPLAAVGKHRDDLFQVEAIFMGQAGLLDAEAISPRHRDQALADGYFARLSNEYRYLQHKFGMQPMDPAQWRFLRLRPQNFPHIRLSQLAQFYYDRRATLSALLECRTVADLQKLLQTHATPYWQTHYRREHAQREAPLEGFAHAARHQHRHTHVLRHGPSQAEGGVVRPCLRPARPAATRAKPHHPALAGVRTRGEERRRLAGTHPAQARILRPP